MSRLLWPIPRPTDRSRHTNKIILQCLKKRLQDADRSWVYELPNVLWAYRTTPRSSTNETPFRMTYGTEAILPIDISLDTPRIEFFDVGMSEEGIRTDNDLLEEVRETAQFLSCTLPTKDSELLQQESQAATFPS